MRTNPFLFCLLFMSQTAIAGGNFVGNGAGLVENNFQYAYSTLGSVFSNCIETKGCEMSDSELQLLEKMSNVVHVNISNVDRIVFVSEVANPEFFTTGIGEGHRIAKTGLTPDVPIYINSDLLYDAEGHPMIDFATGASILTHEIGHQAGIPNHAGLDILGSKIKKVVSQRLSRHTMEFGSDAKSVQVLILNNDFPMKNAEVMFSWENVGSLNLTAFIVRHLTCSNPQSSMAAFEIMNGHFSISPKDTELNPVIGFGMWVNLYCYNPSENLTKLERNSIELEIPRTLMAEVVSQYRISP